MPTNKNDFEAQARKIAMEVGHRRKAGEVLTDAEILQEHPELREPLEEQLGRLHVLETARMRVDQEVADAARTLDLPKPIELKKTPAHDSTAQLRVTLSEPSTSGRVNSTMVLADAGAEEETATAASAIPSYCPSVRAPMAVVKLFHDGEQTFNPSPVMTDRFRIGRTEGDLVVPHDFWMSGRHAEIQRRKIGKSFHWFLVDLNSTNGTFVRADFAALKHNDELFIGQERYRFTDQNGRAGLMHVTTGSGQQWWFAGNSAIIGSQPPSGLRSFTTDVFLNPIHAKLQREPDGTWTIRDNHSHNGLWFRIKEVELPAHSAFQLGEQRFGFWTRTDSVAPAAHLRVTAKPLTDSTE